ncbi:MAG TPA: ABC transporter substrate-binding protein [Anaerolineales bacterium]|nr:ABC transporter substrate-binding protein [Anaerolineales bacterium]
MNNSIRAFILTIIMLILAQSGMACVPQKQPISIAISSWAGVEPVELAAQLGYFEKHGVEVKLIRFSVYSDSIEALIDGKVDAGMHTLDDAIRYYAGGRDVRVVLLTDYSFGNDGLVARPGIDSLTDLRGARIGVETETVGHLSLLKILEAGKLAENDVTIVNIPTWEIEQSMLNGIVDAGVTWEPYLTRTARETGGKVLITSREYPETIITTMTFDAAIVKRRPQDVQNIVAAYFDAVEYIKENPQDAYQRMGQAEGISAMEFEKQAAGIQYLQLADNLTLLDEQSEVHAYGQADAIAQFLFDQGIIQSIPDIHQLLTPLFIQALRK